MSILGHSSHKKKRYIYIYTPQIFKCCRSHRSKVLNYSNKLRKFCTKFTDYQTRLLREYMAEKLPRLLSSVLP